MNKNYKNLISNTLVLTIGTICTKGLIFIMVPFFTKWLSQSDYGIYDLIITYSSLLIPIISLDLSEAVFRFIIDDKNKEDKIISSTLTLIFILFPFVALILILFLKSIFPSITTLILSLVLLFVGFLYTYFTMVLRGEKKLKNYTIANILYVISIFVFSFLFVKCIHLGLNGILLGYILGYLIGLIYMFKLSDVQLSKIFGLYDKKILFKMLKYSLPLIPNAIAWWVMDASDRTIITIFLGTSSSAILAVAHKIPGICQSIYNTFHISWQENAIDVLELETEERNDYFNNVANNMLIILLSISIILISTNFIIFNYIFDYEYFAAYYHAPILISALIFSMLAQFIGGIYIAKKESNKNGITTIICALINLIVHLILIGKIGLFAATISTLISYVFLLLIRYIDIRKYYKMKLNKKSLLVIFIYLYFLSACYLNINILNYINLFVSVIVVILINRQIVLKVYNKVISIIKK